MWMAPVARTPLPTEPVIVMLRTGEIAWARRTDDGWHESDPSGKKLEGRIAGDAEVYAWTYAQDMARRAMHGRW